MSGLADFEALQNAVDDLNGLDLSTTERNNLINEGYFKLATQSGWYRRKESFTAVTDQEAYDLDSDIFQVLELFVAGRVYTYQDEETVRRVEDDALFLRGNGIYWISFDTSGTEQLSIYPTAETGDEMYAIVVARPTALSATTDEPSVPLEFRRAIVDYVAAIALGSVEDAVDLRAFHQQEFDRAVVELRGLRFSRVRSGPVQVRVQGVHY